MTETLTIVIEGKDNVSDDLKKVNASLDNVAQSVKKNSMSMADLHGATQLAVSAFRVGADVFKQTVGVAQEYDQAILKIMASTGGTAEATSRLVQVMDDAGISIDVVKLALKEMSKDGTEPNVQEMAKLSDEFLKLNSGAERGKFLLDNFGKSGTEMARVMQLGGDTLLKMNEGIDENLILTDKAIRESEEYRKNVDELSDSWLGLKVSMGNAMIPAINDMAEFARIEDIARENGAELHGEVVFWAHAYAATFNPQVQASTEYYTAWAEAVENSIPVIDETGEAVEMTTEEIKAMTDANNDMLSLTMKLQKETDNYNSELEETIAKYGKGSKEVQALQAKHKAAFASIAYDLLVAKLKADGFTDAEYKMALAAGVAMGQIDQAAADTASAIDQITNAAMQSEEGMEAYGRIMENVMADGVVSAEELAQSLLEIPTEIRTEIEASVNVNLGAFSEDLLALMRSLRDAMYAPGGGFDPPNCFVEDTPILMADGSIKMIKDIKPNDSVMSYDLEKKFKYSATVGETRVHPETNGYLFVNGIGVTANHIIYINGKWMSAGKIKKGDLLLNRYGQNEKVVSIVEMTETVTTYDITIDDKNHNYFANGVLVHNKAGGGWAIGPGSGMRDSFLAPLANGEFVVNSRAAQKNAGLLEAINSGQGAGGMAGTIINNYGPVTQMFEGTSGDLIGVR